MARDAVAGLGFAMLLAAKLLFPTPAESAVPTASLSPSSSTAGTSVTMSGLGFPLRKSGTVSFGSTLVANFKTGSSGSFKVSFAVPSGYDGDTVVTASVDTVGASAIFTVLPPQPSPSPTPSPSGIWKPAPDTTWQWQLTTPVDQTVEAQMYDIDLFENDAAVVTALKMQARAAVCYVSAGSWESWRPDARVFPSSVIGRAIGWSGERWLDIRQISSLGPIMEARLELCKDKGFDAVEPDNVDGYSNKTGFPLTAADQLVYNRWLSDAAHARGLSVGLKNDIAQAAELEPWFDWALDEQCFQYGECGLLSPFATARKAIFEVEYKLSPASFCPQARALGFMAMKKDKSLDSARTPCW
jgi:Glycoside-hydrolase family GH114/IPT/TIG domain